MSRDHRILRGRLSRAAKVLPKASKQLFRQFLAEMDPSERPKKKKKHSWSKPPAQKKQRRPKRAAQLDLFDPPSQTRGEDPGQPAGTGE